MDGNEPEAKNLRRSFEKSVKVAPWGDFFVS